MELSATDKLLILQGLLDYAADPLRAASDESLKERILTVLRCGGIESASFTDALGELLTSLLDGPHAPAIQEALEEIPSSVDSVRGTHQVPYDPSGVDLDELPRLSAGLQRGLSAQTERQPFAYEVVPIFFATDRAPTGKTEPRHFFSGSRGDLHFGYAQVSIPDRHHRGRLEQPPWFLPLVKQQPQHHVALLDLTTLEEGHFAVHLRAATANAVPQSALIFIHGYNVSFESAAQRTAQMCYDLQFNGIPILYSWPSTGRWYRYTVDAANVESTASNFRHFIDIVRSALPAATLHLLAHSMGNRLVRDFLEQSITNVGRNAARLGELVMAAPDVDATVFRNTRPAAWDNAEHSTLYASSRDWALRLSKRIHGYDRAGDSGGKLVIVDKVDAIDASLVETGLFGHGYYGDASSILTDMFLLLHHRFAPSKRPSLRQRQRDDRVYWEFLP
jgi:esterase/lipase superfamily enzyme